MDADVCSSVSLIVTVIKNSIEFYGLSTPGKILLLFIMLF